MNIDNRLIGTTSENVFLSLLSQQGIFAQSFDTPSFDGVVFDLQKKYFKVGISPSFVQIKCRGSAREQYSTQGHSPEIIDAIRKTAKQIEVPETSLYFVVGFFKNQDIRQSVYYIIPFQSLPSFRGNGQYRFSVKRCEEMLRTVPTISKI
jgi:hypothetical protein